MVQRRHQLLKNSSLHERTHDVKPGANAMVDLADQAILLRGSGFIRGSG